jgi:hypothetical protein
MKGKNSEACVEICDGDDTMEDDVDPKYLLDVEENYDDVTQSLAAANGVLEQNGQLLASMVGALVTASGPAESCSASTDWLGFAEALATMITKLAATWTRGLADLANIACGQDVAGFNGSLLCIPTEAAAAVQDFIADATEGAFGLVKVFADNSAQRCLGSLSADLQDAKTTLTDLTATLGTVASTTSGSSNQLTGVVADVQNLQTTVNDLTASVAALRATVDAVTQQIADLFDATNKRFDAVETLLNTPLGQRPEYPKP